MKQSDVRRYGVAVGVTLAAVIVLGLVGAAFAQAPDGAAPTVGDAAAATVASRISYQGVLREGGAPVNGTRNMQFRLYGDTACADVYYQTIVKNDVPVGNGLFTVELDVLQTIFDGREIGLELAVADTVIGCQTIVPVPYALGLRPGAKITGPPNHLGHCTVGRDDRHPPDQPGYLWPGAHRFRRLGALGRGHHDWRGDGRWLCGLRL